MTKKGEEQIFFPFRVDVLVSCMLYSLFPHLFTPPTPYTHTYSHTKLHNPSPISPPPPSDGLAAYPHHVACRRQQWTVLDNF